MTVLKEFLVYLRNTKDTNAVLRYMEKIKPLDMDISLLNDYMSKLVIGNVPQFLIDEVETLYLENEYSVDRMREVGLIGDTNVLFEIGEVFECIQQIEDFVDGSIKNDDFAVKFIELINQIDDEVVTQNFYDVVKLCEKFIEKQLNRQAFIDALSNALIELKYIYNIWEDECFEE